MFFDRDPIPLNLYRDPPILSIRILHSLMDLVAAAQHFTDATSLMPVK